MIRMMRGKKQIIAGLAVGAALSGLSLYQLFGAGLKKEINNSDKNLSRALLLNKWLDLKQENKSLSEYFVQNNYKEISIYGMGYVGERLIKELKGTGITIKYIIDKNAACIDSDYRVCSLNDELARVDVVVVSLTYYFEEIKEELQKRVKCPIISLEEAVFSL